MSTVTQTASPARPGKYLSFRLGNQEYGLAIPKVQEIVGLGLITRVPHTPPWVRGVIKLRGHAIPVVDLRARFALPAAEETEQTCVIVVQVAGDDLLLTLGVVVDEVCEVLSFTRDQIVPTSGAVIAGRGQLGDKDLNLLDVDRLWTGEELAAAATVGHEYQEVLP